MAVRKPLIQQAGNLAELSATDILTQIGVFAYRTTSITGIAPGTTTLIEFDAHDSNMTAEMHDVSTNNSRLIAVVEGWYSVVANVRWAGISISDPPKARQIHTLKNGTTVIGVNRVAAIPGDGSDHGGKWDIYLAIGDYVTLHATHQHTGNLDLLAVNNWTPYMSLFLK